MVEIVSALAGHVASTTNLTTSWTWYVIRAAGFVAAGLLFLLMVSGIGQVTGLTYKVIEPVKAWAIHRALALALCGAIAIHVGLLLIDKFLPFTLAQAFIPFVSHYSNHTKLLGIGLSGIGVALGIFAMYGVVVIVASSLGWIDSKKDLKRLLHYISYFVILAVFVHALSVGSDLKYGLFREAWIAVSALLLLMILSRLRRAGTLKNHDES